MPTCPSVPFKCPRSKCSTRRCALRLLVSVRRSRPEVGTAIAEVSGRIVAIHPALESGNWIKAGETLVTIDEKDYQLRLTQRLADLDSAKASLAELLASEAADKKISCNRKKDLLSISRKEVKRTQRLTESKAASTSALEQAEGNRLRQVQAVQRLENSLSLYPSRIAAAKSQSGDGGNPRWTRRDANVDRTVIKSPMNGVISGADIEIGQFLRLNQQLFEIQDTETIEIKAQLSLAQLKQLQPVQREDGASLSVDPSWLHQLQAEVTTESGDRTFRWQGRAVRLTESVDEQTRTIGLVVQVTNEPQDAVISLTNSRVATTPGHQYNDSSRATSFRMSKQSESAVRTESPRSPQEFAARGQSAPKSGTYCEVRLIGAPQSKIIAIPRTAMDGEQVYIVDADQTSFQSRNCATRRQRRGIASSLNPVSFPVIESSFVHRFRPLKACW